MIPRGRGRGRGNSSNRGGRAIIQPLVQNAGGKLINARIQQGQIAGSSSQTGSSSSQFSEQFPLLQGNDQLYQQFMQFMQQQKQGVNKTPYKDAIIQEEENNSSTPDFDYYIKNPYRETILVLEYQDIAKFHFELEETPWQLLSRYLGEKFFTAQAYKPREYYEKILLDTLTCEIKHTESQKLGQKFYAFSKITIKRILTMADWGISPFREKQFVDAEKKLKLSYNYWDYVESLHKVFYYQNPNYKHSWFIKVASSVYNPSLPTWFFIWWKSFGPSIQILVEPFKSFYIEWLNVCPKLFSEKRAEDIQEIIPSLIFFTEFSIPWIWKWEPEIEYGDNEYPGIKRAFFTKFWINMVKNDEKTGEIASKDTITHIEAALLRYSEQKKIKEKEELKKLAPMNPLCLIEAKLLSQGITHPTREQIMVEYMKQFQEDIIKYHQDTEQKSDASMKTSSGDENQFKCLAGESQEIEDEDLELSVPDLFMELQSRILKSSKSSNSTQEDKGKSKEES